MTTPIQQQIEAIARECCLALGRQHWTGQIHIPVANTERAREIVLTAANRIAALKVKESGAVEALGYAKEVVPPGGMADLVLGRALKAINTLITEGTP